MHCPNCGRELMEGEVCNCTQNTAPVNETPVNEVPVNEAPAYGQPPVQEQYQAPQPNYYQPQDPNAAYYQAPVAPVAQPVAQLPARTDYPEGYKIKRKYVSVILAACLGYIGIHDFYLGRSTKGIIKILLFTVGAIFVGLGPIAAYIWAIVDAVQLLEEVQDRDENGFKIQTFEEALVAQRMKAEADAEAK